MHIPLLPRVLDRARHHVDGECLTDLIVVVKWLSDMKALH